MKGEAKSRAFLAQELQEKLGEALSNLQKLSVRVRGQGKALCERDAGVAGQDGAARVCGSIVCGRCSHFPLPVSRLCDTAVYFPLLRVWGVWTGSEGVLCG